MSTRPLRCLIVGAGAVGQTYGTHLALGGAEVSVFVKKRYAEAAREGFQGHRYNGKKATRLLPRAVFSEVEALAGHSFDQVWLCMASDALRSPLVERLLDTLGDALIVSVQPGPLDAAWLAERVPAERRVQGIITFIAHTSPLPDAPFSADCAWWFPPLTPSLFSGPRADEAVRALKAGGCPARRMRDVAPAAGAAGSFMMPWIAALELSGWRFKQLFGTPAHAKLGAQAAREAHTIALEGRKAHHRALFTRPFFLRVATLFAPLFVPFPLEPYVQQHFQKVGAQTLALLHTFIELGQAKGRSTQALEALHSALDEARRDRT